MSGLVGQVVNLPGGECRSLSSADSVLVGDIRPHKAVKEMCCVLRLIAYDLLAWEQTSRLRQAGRRGFLPHQFYTNISIIIVFFSRYGRG